LTEASHAVHDELDDELKDFFQVRTVSVRNGKGRENRRRAREIEVERESLDGNLKEIEQDAHESKIIRLAVICHVRFWSEKMKLN
jgi:hypothetical protein